MSGPADSSSPLDAIETRLAQTMLGGLGTPENPIEVRSESQLETTHIKGV